MKDAAFSSARLLALYDRISDTEGAIPRLRRFVLDLAVRGKLVDQDASDEPVRLGNSKALTAPFRDPPTQWVALQVGQALELKYGKGKKASERLDVGPIPVFGSNGIVGYSDEGLTEQPSIIIGRKGSAGALQLCNGPSWTTDVAYFVLAPEFFDLKFLLLTFQSLDLDELGKGVKPGLSRADAYALEIQVPPLAEQHRIVAKVDELMALCDKLEQARAGREAVRDRLTAASLARLTTSDTDAQTFQSRARFALQSFPTLTTRPDQIKALRQTILTLAVRGKLVAQDAADEPAAELLKRIAKEISSKRKEMGLRPNSALPSVVDDDAPFDLPCGWAWARFPEVGVFARGKSKHRPRNDPTLYVDGTVPFVQTGDVARSGGVVTTHSAVYNDAGLRQSMLWPAGTMCITIAANIADSGILTFDACFPDSVVGLVVASHFQNARFFEYFVRTAKANLTEFAPATAQKNINLGILEMVLIPLPPLAEQHRIVARVDALMALCDHLEASLTTTATTRSKLLEALLHEALEPAAKELEAAE